MPEQRHVEAIQITEQEGYQNIRKPRLAFLSVFSKSGDLFLLAERVSSELSIETRPILKVLNENPFRPKDPTASEQYMLSYIGSASTDGVNVWHVYFETTMPIPGETNVGVSKIEST